jgi:hypothetical protein
LNNSKGIAIGTRYDQTISYEGADVGIMDKLDRIKAARIVITTADSFDPHFVFSAQTPKAAAVNRIAHSAQ